MKPYYNDEKLGLTIYCGRCEEILPQLEKVDLVLTDPPYGIGSWCSTGGHNLSASEATEANKWDFVPNKEIFDLIKSMSNEQIIWGGNYLCGMLGPWKNPMIWDKKYRGLHLADAEIAWTSFKKGTVRVFDLARVSCEIGRLGLRTHPTEKPIELFNWCILQSKTTGMILDPFLGSGTTLRAAKDLGRKAIGIEVNEKYCELAVERLRQEVLITT